MQTLRRTAAVLMFPTIAWLGAACEQRDTPTEAPRISASYSGSHSGTYTVWSLNEHLPCCSHFPHETMADLSSLSGHLAGGPVMITAVPTEKEGSGNLYWNPVTNAFAYYGPISDAFWVAIDLDRRAILSTGEPGSFGGGNVWASGTVAANEVVVGTPAPHVQFRGTGNMRRYNVAALGPELATGIRVNLANGKVYFGTLLLASPDPTGVPLGGALIELDPATNVVRRWETGSGPYFLELDAQGLVYATAVAAGEFPDQIIRLDPTANSITRWDIPGGGLQGSFSVGTPNYIVRDLEGNLWFSESASDQYGRLNPLTNTFEEFTKLGISNPHGIGTSGLGPTLQMYGQEATGNTTDILTRVAATPLTTFALPYGQLATPPTTSTASFEDFVAPRLDLMITPTMTTVTSTNGAGIDRFPQPPGVSEPTSATGVVLPNTIVGSAWLSGHVEMFVSPAIVAEPPRPVCPPDDDDDKDGLNNSNESVLKTLVGIADSDGDGIKDGNDDANGNGEDDEDEDDDDACPDPDSDGDGTDDEDEDDDDDDGVGQPPV